MLRIAIKGFRKLLFFAPVLDFKMAIFKMSIMPKIAIKSNRKLLVDVSLAAILDFKRLPL